MTSEKKTVIENEFEQTAAAEVIAEENKTDFEQPVDEIISIKKVEIDGLKDKIELLTKALAETNDKYLRTLADTENFKKRKQEEIIGIRKFALETIISEMLPIIDNFKRAFSEQEKCDTIEKAMKVIEGLKMIQTQMDNILTKFGLEKFESANTKFNPEMHNAIQCEETDDETRDNIVVEEYQNGYKLSGKIIRAAMVKVAKYNK